MRPGIDVNGLLARQVPKSDLCECRGGTDVAKRIKSKRKLANESWLEAEGG